MSECKLVPVEPTPEMVEAAEDAYMPFGDMDLAIRMALLAAPAVQGEADRARLRERFDEIEREIMENKHTASSVFTQMRTDVLYTAPQPAPAVQNKPMSFCEDAALSLAERTFSSEVDEQLAEDVIQYARRLHTLYATPQPAEQQPCPDGVREGAPYDDPAFESLCREHEVWGTAAAAQCAVFWEAGKRAAEQQPAPDVDVLVEALERIASWPDGGNQSGQPHIKMFAAKAIAAHRKQGGDQ